MNGERRNFALLRAARDPAAQQPLRELVLEAYEAEAAVADAMAVEKQLGDLRAVPGGGQARATVYAPRPRPSGSEMPLS